MNNKLIVTIDNDDKSYPFPKWIYSQESVLYVLDKCNNDVLDKCNIQSMPSPVAFTSNEITAINQALSTNQQIAYDYITKNFKQRLHIFNCYFNCPVIESVIESDTTLWAVYNDCLYMFERSPEDKTKYFNVAIQSGSLNIIKYCINEYPYYLCTKSFMVLAIKCNNLNIVKLLYRNDDTEYGSYIMDIAIGCGHMKIIK